MLAVCPSVSLSVWKPLTSQFALHVSLSDVSSLAAVGTLFLPP